MRVMLVLACTTLLSTAALAREKLPKNPTPEHDESSKQMKCLAACQEPAEKCLTKCGKSVSCMERCTKDMQMCSEGCGIQTGEE